MNLVIFVNQTKNNEEKKRGEKRMALINCPECGKQISDKAEKCIHCGHQMKEQKVTKEKEEKGRDQL